MYRVYIFICILIFSVSIVTPASSDDRLITTEDLLFNPSDEFLDDFFEKLAEGSYIYPETQDSTLVLRRLHSFAQNVESGDFITAWQTLINLPEHPAYPVIMEIKREAQAVNSVMTWFGDRDLRSRFIEAYNDIWLKHDGVDDDLESFKEIFSGYASRRESRHPAAFIYDNVSYYGYTKAPGQPSDSTEFIWHLFKDFSSYSSTASKKGFDYRIDDPAEVSKSLMISTASSINSAWNEAIHKEKTRLGDDVFIIDKHLISFDSDFDEIIPLTEAAIESVDPAKEPKSDVIDYSVFNVFALPDDADTDLKIPAQFKPEDPVDLPVEKEPYVEEIIEIKPLDPSETDGLEPPEFIIIGEEPDVEEIVIIIDDPAEYEPVVRIPSTEPEEPAKDDPAIEHEPTEIELEEPVEDYPLPESEPEAEEITQYADESLESIFVAPDVRVVEPATDDDKPATVEPVQIPKIDPDEPSEEVTTESVDLLQQTPETTDEEKPFIIIPDDDEEEIEEVEPEKQAEIRELARRVKSKTIDTAHMLGKHAVELVILWESNPELIEDYEQKESDIRDKFSIRKEEFLTLLHIIDAFRLEEELGMNFDALNGEIINALHIEANELIRSDQIYNYPNVTAEKLLTAINKLRVGVESRRDTLSIQDASRKAYSRHQLKYEDIVSQLSDLMQIEISGGT